MRSITNYLKKRFTYQFFIGWLVWTFSFFIPYLILKENSYIRIHDTLEGELVWLEILRKSGHMHSLLNDTILYDLMYGLPRNVLPSGFTLLANMCYLFGMIKGYIVSQYIFKTIGYVFFYEFVKKYMVLRSLNEWYIVATCLLLTSIQFFTPFGISVVGIPMLVYGFARLYYQKASVFTNVIFFIFPFCSSFVWSGIEIIILFNLYLIYLFYLKHDTIRKWVYAWFSFIIGTLLANIQFIYGMVFLKGFRSHRVDYIMNSDVPNFTRTVTEFIAFFFSTHYHISIFISLLIFVVFLISYYGVEKNFWAKKFFLIILGVVIWQAIYPFVEYMISDIVFIRSFRFNRFAFILPFMWFLLLIISLETLSKQALLRKTIPLIIFSQFLLLFFSNDETAHNYKKLLGVDNFPSYSEYLAIDQYKIIEKKIPKLRNQKVISFGISPTVAQYHGFPTLDGLFSVYDLDFKKDFRKIIEKELEKDQKLKTSFDTWGNRCYMFSSELGLENVQNVQSAHDCKKVRNLQIDVNQIKKMGGKYIISAVEILNYKTLGLKFIGKEGTSTHYWTLYLYEA